MPTIKSCCSHTKKNKVCERKKDKKKFTLPRKFSKKKCTKKTIKGFSMKSSCAPYKYCSKKKTFLYNPDDPKKSFDVYIDKNPKDTIPIAYTTVTDVTQTIKKLERLYKQKKYTHKRIWQVGMIMKVRLEVIKKKYPKAKYITRRYALAKKYFLFLGRRTKIKGEKRYSFVFTF